MLVDLSRDGQKKKTVPVQAGEKSTSLQKRKAKRGGHPL